MVSAAMSANAVLELNILPQKCTVNPKYYVDNILAEPCKMHLLIDKMEVPTHTSKLSQEWSDNYEKIWSENLSPIIYLWAVIGV